MATQRIISPTGVPGSATAVGVTRTQHQFVLSGTERLRVAWITDDVTLILVIAGRMLTLTGDIEPFQFAMQSGATTLTTQEFVVGAGSLLTLTASVQTQGGLSMWGRNWTQVQLIQGTGAAAIVVGTLVQSYITTFQPAVWPGTPFRPAVEGPGLQVDLVGTAPAAGNQSQLLTPPATTRGELITCLVTLLCSATVANRRVFLSWATATGAVATFISPVVQIANQFMGYTFAAQASTVDGSSTGRVVIGISPHMFHQYATGVATPQIGADGLQAGDQFSACFTSWLRWQEPGI